MNISLKQFLHTGRLGYLHAGMAAQQIRYLLGKPEDVGGTSRQHPHPSVYVYGTVEIWFQRQAPYALTGIFWEADSKGAFLLPACCTIEDWALMPSMHLTDVENWLRENQFAFVRLPNPTPELPIRLGLPSGVQINFDEGEQLASVYAGLGQVRNLLAGTL